MIDSTDMNSTKSVDDNKNNNGLDSTAKKAGLWYTIGNFILKGCLFLSLPIFTRILSQEEFGIYNTYVAYEAILTAILGLGFYGSIRNAKLKYKTDFNKYISTVMSLCVFWMLIIFLVLNGFYLMYEKYINFSRLIINILILQSFGSAIIQIYATKLNIEFKYKSYLVISLINTIGNIALSIILILFVFPNERYFGRILGNAIPFIIIGVLIVIKSLIDGHKIYDKNFWKYALRLGIPLVPHVICQSILSQFDRIMITNMIGEAESGIYSFYYTLCTILTILATSLDSAWTPWMYMKKNSNNDGDIRKPSRIFVLFFALMTLGFICVMPEIAYFFGDEEYRIGIDLIVPLSLANYFIFLYFLPVNIEYYNNKTFFISFGTIIAALLNFIMNLIFIPIFGYKAAAYTTFISYLLLFLIHICISSRYGFFKIYDIMYIFVVSLILIGAAFIILFIENYNVISIIVRYSIIVLILVYLFTIRKVLFSSIFSRKKEVDNNV